MARFPPIASAGRGRLLAAIVALGLLQAAGLGVVAFATRSAFADLHAGLAPDLIALGRLAGGGIAAAGFSGLGRVVSERLGQNYVMAVRQQFYGHIAGMNLSELGRMRTGTLAIRFVGDLSAVRGWVGLGLGRLIVAGCVIPVAAIALWVLDPLLAVAGMVPLVLSLALAGLAGLGLQAQHGKLRRQRWLLAAGVVERLKAAPELDLLGRTKRELSRLEEAGERLAKNATSRRFTSESLKALPHLGGAVGGCAILYLTAAGGLAAADAAAALSVLALLVTPSAELTTLWDRYCAWILARAAGQRLLARPSRRRQIDPHADPVGVSVRDRQGRLLLSARPGAIVEVSAAGAMLRQIAAQDQSGELQVDYGNGGPALPKIAYINPHSIVLKGSLRRNLTLGASPRPSVSEVRRVAKSFGLASLLDRLGTTKTPLTEGGWELTDRERLMVLLTRACLMRPQLLVVDHPGLHAADSGMVEHLNALTGATILVNART